ncbi:uncharacterized protein LOC109792902 isoform X2 [Cajanus cajan]|uniref:uncharacterized protein LOC109792902 isoform X2 n=1 Tax=Cajanus cajan TaxID=3821 RepID=UPI00098D89E5|nr:uncharacterized protein LOC109792902 isoform X2 [Cajanus cajan]
MEEREVTFIIGGWREWERFLLKLVGLWPIYALQKMEKHFLEEKTYAAPANSEFLLIMKFLDWYLKIGVVSALVGASMEMFMIKTGFYDKVTVLESEKRAWENSPDAQAIREALNPWRHIDAEETKKS